MKVRDSKIRQPICPSYISINQSFSDDEGSLTAGAGLIEKRNSKRSGSVQSYSIPLKQKYPQSEAIDLWRIEGIFQFDD